MAPSKRPNIGSINTALQKDANTKTHSYGHPVASKLPETTVIPPTSQPIPPTELFPGRKARTYGPTRTVRSKPLSSLSSLPRVPVGPSPELGLDTDVSDYGSDNLSSETLGGSENSRDVSDETLNDEEFTVGSFSCAYATDDEYQTDEGNEEEEAEDESLSSLHSHYGSPNESLEEKAATPDASGDETLFRSFVKASSRPKVTTSSKEDGSEKESENREDQTLFNVPFLEKTCPFLADPHGGTFRVSCTDYDPLIPRNLRPGMLHDRTVYSVNQHTCAAGFPLFAATYRGDIVAWIMPSHDDSHALLHRLLLSFHKVESRITWEIQDRVPGRGIRFLGSGSWVARCDEGDGLETYFNLPTEKRHSANSSPPHSRNNIEEPEPAPPTSPVSRLFNLGIAYI